MNSSVVSAVTTVAVLAITGALAGRLVSPVWSAMQASDPTVRLVAADGAAGSGATLGMLGGARGLVADGLWLKLHARWEERDIAGTEALVRMVSAVDPKPEYFWQNGARILGYDLAAWRIEAAGGYDAVPIDVQRRIVGEQARAALAHLDAARPYHETSAELWIERANIENRRLGDLEAAAKSYRRAAEREGAPAYAARLHAEMLRRLGRRKDALAWLVKLHPTVAPGDEAAGADVVLARIRELETELGVSEADAYRGR